MALALGHADTGFGVIFGVDCVHSAAICHEQNAKQ